MEIYNTNFDVRSKGDDSPVTEADEKGEALIRTRLENAYPEIPFIGEESHAAGHKPAVDGGLFWLVDALDGTKEFINKRGEFTVNIALIDAGCQFLGLSMPQQKNGPSGEVDHTAPLPQMVGTSHAKSQPEHPGQMGLSSSPVGLTGPERMNILNNSRSKKL